MIKEIYTAALGMLPEQTKLEVIANNLANSNSIGFKREGVFEREIIEAKLNLLKNMGIAETADLPIGTYTDFAVGKFENTGNPLDIAIDNPNGFFQLEDEEGNQFLTRAGNFQLSKDGFIIAKDGKFLLGEQGRLNVLREFVINSSTIEGNTSANIKITERGEVFLNQAFIGKINIIKVEQLGSLEKINGIYFKPSDKTQMENFPQDEILLRQGWLESSNVDVIREMVDLIELQRLFDLGTKVIQTNDNTLEQSIRIGRFI